MADGGGGLKRSCGVGTRAADALAFGAVVCDAVGRIALTNATEARYWLAGNLRRCTGYDKVIRAVLDRPLILVQVEGYEEHQPARRRSNWRSDSACSRIELGTTKAGVSTFG